MKRLFLLLFAFSLLTSVASKADNWQETEFYGNGQIHKLSDYKGKVVVVMFWATWCPYCKNQMPALSMLKRLYSSANNLAVLAVSIDDGGEALVQNYFKTYNLTNLESYIDIQSNLLHSFGFSAVPTVVLISPEGKMLGSYGGLQHLDVEYIEELLTNDANIQKHN